MEFSAPISIEQAKMLNPLSLAFVGDAVQTLYVRQLLTKKSDAKAGALHILASNQIKSSSQALTLDKLTPLLNVEELDLVRRTRNTKYNTTAKNSSLLEYKKASGLEAVFGLLYLTGQYDRLKMLLDESEKE